MTAEITRRAKTVTIRRYCPKCGLRSEYWMPYGSPLWQESAPDLAFACMLCGRPTTVTVETQEEDGHDGR